MFAENDLTVPGMSEAILHVMINKPLDTRDTTDVIIEGSSNFVENTHSIIVAPTLTRFNGNRQVKF